MDICLRYGAAIDRDLGIVEPRRKPAARRVHNHAFDLHPGHTLRRIDGKPDCCFRRVHINDGAALYPARALMSNTEDAAAMVRPRSVSKDRSD